MSQRLIVASHVPIESTGKDTHSIEIVPKGYIKSIHISINTAVAVSGGAAVANCGPKSFKVWYNGTLIVHIDGQSEVDDLESGGPSILRFLDLMNAGVAATANYWNIIFPTPLPPGDVVFQIVNQSATQIGSTGTITAGDYNIEVEYAIVDKKGKGKPNLPLWKTGLWSDDNDLGLNSHLLPAFNKPIRMIAFCTHDAGTRSATTYTSLQIEYNGQTLFDGTLAKLT
ncbi:unnamed protein product, partial [marine sediment metagenome]